MRTHRTGVTGRRRLLAPLVGLLVCLPLAVACRDGGRFPAPARSRPPVAAAPRPGGTAPQPVGQDGGWKLVFADEFEDRALDATRWADSSSAEADDGHGNKDNGQLEWNQAANCRVAAGELVMTARRERFLSPSGTHYDWTSCLISSTPAYAFQHGYLEERAILPAAKGFWAAFWTWQAPSVHRQVETDVYELYSVHRRELQLTQHSGSRGRCTWRPRFDPAAGWHVYAAAIEPSGTTWYVDGVRVCHTTATSDGLTNIISNLAVDGENPPSASTATGVKRVDYIRAWER